MGFVTDTSTQHEFQGQYHLLCRLKLYLIHQFQLQLAHRDVRMRYYATEEIVSLPYSRVYIVTGYYLENTGTVVDLILKTYLTILSVGSILETCVPCHKEHTVVNWCSSSPERDLTFGYES